MKEEIDTYQAHQIVATPAMLDAGYYWQVTDQQQRERYEREEAMQRMLRGIEPAFVI